MEVISILLVVVVILLFALFIIFISGGMNGGDYMKYIVKSNGSEISPSISQICWEDYSPMMKELINKHITDKPSEDLLISIIEMASEKLKSNATSRYNNEDVIISGMSTMRTVSDAHIDLLGSLITLDPIVINVNKAYAVCEWNGNKHIIKNNQLLTTYRDNKIEIINGNLTNLSNEMYSIINSSQIKLYIEFSYRDGRSYDFYNHFHIMTSKLIPSMMKIGLDIGQNVIIAVRIKCIKSIEDIVDELIDNKNRVSRNRCTLIVYDEAQYNKIKIPNSTEFYYDEEIVILDSNGKSYEIQIEHSENEGNHKSNMVEFIARNVSEFSETNQDMLDFLKLTSYRYSYFNNKTGKYDINPRNVDETSDSYKKCNIKFDHNSVSSLNETAIFKSFGNYGYFL